MLLQPEDATRFLLQHQDQLGDFSDMAPFLIAWADRARSGAGERLLADVPGDDRDDMGEILRKQATMADPAKTLRDPAALEHLNSSEIEALSTRWFKADPSGLLAWRASLTEGNTRQTADTAILDFLQGLKDDAPTLQSKIASLPADLADRIQLRLQTRELSDYHHVADQPSLPPPDPAALAAKLADARSRHPLPDDELSATSRAINAAFIESGQFPEAARWLSGMPENQSAPDECVRSLVSDWVLKDSTAASAWIDSLPAGHLRDQAANQLVETIQEDDPVNAIVWAKSISDQEARQKAVNGVYRQWFETDPAAASQAVQHLPPGEQQSLRREKKTGEPAGDAVIIGNAIDSLLEHDARVRASLTATPNLSR
jgi:hypothetical protein